jgi:hypothetical protein
MATTQNGIKYPQMIVAHAAMESDTKAALALNSSGALLWQVDRSRKTDLMPSRSTKSAYSKYAMLYTMTRGGMRWLELESHWKINLMMSLRKTSSTSCKVTSQKYGLSGTSQPLSKDTTYALVSTTQQIKMANSNRLKIRATTVITSWNRRLMHSQRMRAIRSRSSALGRGDAGGGEETGTCDVETSSLLILGALVPRIDEMVVAVGASSITPVVRVPDDSRVTPVGELRFVLVDALQ